MKRIIIIGAGSIGTNAALILDALGFTVTLIDQADDILDGSAQVTCVNHGDGFEYYTPDHTATGHYCIDGALTKGLLYSLTKLRTEVATDKNPIRFFASNASVNAGFISLEGFHRNVEDMHRHFTAKFHAIMLERHWSIDTASHYFLRQPKNFFSRLSPDSYTDVHGAASGYAGSSFGINMPHYYAIVKAALKASAVECRFKARISQIRKESNAYRLYLRDEVIVADHILLCCSHHIPQVASKIEESTLAIQFDGTFYLNCMSFVKLPATDNIDLISKVNRINFFLQQEEGGMFACLLPPSKHSDGYAAIYYPSPKGSQLSKHEFWGQRQIATPPEWDQAIQDGLPNSHPNVQVTFEHSLRLYPFLRGYAALQRTSCRPVFNASTHFNRYGLIRSIRDISPTNGRITEDHRVSAWSAPKWTNAELVALMAVDFICRRSGIAALPRDDRSGCGPTELNVAKFSEHIHFRNVVADARDAAHYASRAQLPHKMAVSCDL